MSQILSRAAQRVRGAQRNEDGSEMVAMIFVLPFLLVLVFALFDVGIMFSSRFYATNVVRDATRNVAIYGGNTPLYGPMRGTGETFEDIAEKRLWKDGHCVIGGCTARPVVNCTPETVPEAGQLVQCTVTYYYRGINTGFLSSSYGMGFGDSLDGFTIKSEAYAEVGANGVAGIG
jgi:TadE-like protein